MGFFIISFIALTIFILISRNTEVESSSSIWLNGKIPPQMPFNRDNLMEVYLALAILMIKQEKRDTKEKITYLRSYIKRKFPKASDNLTESLGYALRDESVDLKTAATWINKHVALKGKIQIIQFLCDISFIDGKLHPEEEKMISFFSVSLKVPIEEVRSIVAGLEEAYDRKNNYSKSKTYTSSSTTKSSINYKKKRMATILEIHEESSFSEIKKAYRRLAKLHHPDKFQNASPEQIKLAQERFVEIQKAYEYFEKLLN
ncbi:MAG: DnaJ domain-containing protein [Crocinitomicaceae bacterium]